jgi:hypothetical protein
MTKQNDLCLAVEAATKGHFGTSLLRDLLRGTPMQKGSEAAATAEVKRFFTSLGRSCGFKATAGQTAGAHGGEWLYDLAWYEERDGFYSRQIMVLESEMRLGRIGECYLVNGDFHKLVQARADIRVWVASLPTGALLSKHLENCQRQADAFSTAEADDFYLFVLFDYSINKTEVTSWRPRDGRPRRTI